MATIKRISDLSAKRRKYLDSLVESYRQLYFLIERGVMGEDGSTNRMLVECHRHLAEQAEALAIPSEFFYQRIKELGLII